LKQDEVIEISPDRRDRDAIPAAFKVRVQNPRQPSIKQQIAAGKQQIAASRADAPARTAAALFVIVLSKFNVKRFTHTVRDLL
jgi:hypothetical protein